ncbi:hypothetical protein ACHAXT_010097 [Thalassiosira profunda]
MARHPLHVCVAALLCACTSPLLQYVHGFAPPSIPATATRIRPLVASPSRLHSANGTEGDPADEEARRLQDKAAQYRTEAEKLRLTLGLQKIEELEGEIREFVKGGDDAASSGKREEDKLQELKVRVEDLVRGSLGKEEAEGMLAGLASFASASSTQASSGDSDSTSLPPLTDKEMARALALLVHLPAPVKDTLARAAGYPGWESKPSMEKLVRRLYENNGQVSTEALRRMYGQAFSENLPSGGGGKSAQEELDEEYSIKGLTKALSEYIDDEVESGTRAMELFPRTVQDVDEELLPSEADADVVFQLLEKSFMATEKPTKVKGGYIIRGVNKRKSASELLDVLDGRLGKKQPDWTDNYQLSYVEIYSDATEELFEDALLVTPNKFPLVAPKLLAAATTAVALFSSFVYSIDTFGENEAVMQRLKDAAETAQAGGVYDLTWFNDLLVPLLVTLGAAQGAHELGHLLAAWAKQVKLSSPTILPSQALPYLSFQNRLKTSPKGYSDLFDIAFVGPVAGLSVSFVALLVGLQLTTTVDPSAAQVLPSLPVGFLTQSTLGGTIVDLVLGGGDGILLNQDAATQVPLHPVAIGGFLGMIIHALDLVPVGSTDGGRMSQAVLGRVWHLTFSSLLFFGLFVTSFFSDSSILLGFLFIYSFTQRDMEIPCRNEIDKVELPRAVAALVSWLLAALILVPL